MATGAVLGSKKTTSTWRTCMHWNGVGSKGSAREDRRRDKCAVQSRLEMAFTTACFMLSMESTTANRSAINSTCVRPGANLSALPSVDSKCKATFRSTVRRMTWVSVRRIPSYTRRATAFANTSTSPRMHRLSCSRHTWLHSSEHAVASFGEGGEGAEDHPELRQGDGREQHECGRHQQQRHGGDLQEDAHGGSLRSCRQQVRVGVFLAKSDGRVPPTPSGRHPDDPGWKRNGFPFRKGNRFGFGPGCWSGRGRWMDPETIENPVEMEGPPETTRGRGGGGAWNGLRCYWAP